MKRTYPYLGKGNKYESSMLRISPCQEKVKPSRNFIKNYFMFNNVSMYEDAKRLLNFLKDG